MGVFTDNMRYALEAQARAQQNQMQQMEYAAKIQDMERDAANRQMVGEILQSGRPLEEQFAVLAQAMPEKYAIPALEFAAKRQEPLPYRGGFTTAQDYFGGGGGQRQAPVMAQGMPQSVGEILDFAPVDMNAPYAPPPAKLSGPPMPGQMQSLMETGQLHQEMPPAVPTVAPMPQITLPDTRGLSPDTASTIESSAAKAQIEQSAKIQEEQRAAKAKSAEEYKERQNIERLLSEMADLYKQLEAGGGIPVKPKEGANALERTMISASNPIRYVAGTPAGQVVGGARLTENQIVRDQITSKIPDILASVKKAKGLTGTQMDSKAEQKLFMQMTGGLTKGYDANLPILKSLSQSYGLGDLSKQKTDNQGKEAEAIFEQRRTEQKSPRAGVIEDGHIFIGGDPSKEENWRKIN